MTRRLKKPVVYGLYCLGLVMFIGLIYVIELSIPDQKLSSHKDVYVTKNLFDDVIPVIKTEDKLVKPYTKEDVSETKEFYDYKADNKEQEKSIVYYQNTYMQSTGITYSNVDKFDVISVLPGEVEEVKEDELLGKTIKIKHNDNLYSLYECLSTTNVNKGDKVIQGQIIGVSGTSKINNSNNNLYFELILNGNSINPNSYYGKTLKEIQ